MELIVGAANKSELNKINSDVHQFQIALIDNTVSQLAMDMLRNYTLSHGLSLPDALIAATAIEARLELFTYNVKHYKFIDGINLYSPIIK